MSYKEIGNLRKLLIDSLSQYGASFETSYHCDALITAMAQQVGVQPNDLLVLSETSPHGEITAVVGLRDPYPSADQHGDLISFKHAASRDWTPSNQPRYGRPATPGDAIEARLDAIRRQTDNLPDETEARLDKLREIGAALEADTP